MDQLLTIGQITRETMMVLENSLTFTGRVRRDLDDQFAKSGAKIGSVVNVRKPVRFVDTTGQGLQLQDLTETSVPVTLTTQYQRAFTCTTADLALNIDDYSKRFIRPAVASLANQIDFDGLSQYINIYNTVGTPGTPITLLTGGYLAAGQRLDEEACPRDDERYLVLNPAQQASIVGGLTNIFNPTSKISAQYSRGLMSSGTIGFDWYMDQNVRSQTVGPLGGTPTLNGVPASGATSIVTTGWTAAAASRLKKGDVFTIANVFAVNPQSHQTTGALRQFVVTADFSSDGSGNGTVNISPAIVYAASGPNPSQNPFQTVNAAPATTAAITVLGAANTVSPQGLAFHHAAFVFANADLPKPGGVDMADVVRDKQLGMSIRCVRAYDINTDRMPLRLDLLGGWATLYPELAVRIAS